MAVPTHTIGIAASPAGEEIVAPQLIAGDTPPFVSRDVLIPAAMGAIPQYTPLTRAASGAWGLWSVAAAPGLPISGITMYAIPDAGDQRAAVCTEGMLNIDAIAWPAGTQQFEVEQGMTQGLQFRKLLYSDKRVTVADTINVGDGNTAPAVG